MINSMTGYGEAQGEFDGVAYSVEIKAVNNRYLKTSVKLPELVAFLEAEVEKLIRSNLARGTINYVLRLRHVSTDVLFNINEAALRSIMEKVGRVASSVDIKCPVDIGGLFSLPGILEPVSPEEELAERIRENVLKVTQQAIDKLKQMRGVEGAALEEDLLRQCDAISRDIERIRVRADIVLQEYHSRLKKRVEVLVAEAKLKLDEETLAREVAVFAERSDISEEIARLDSHLQQFAETCRNKTGGGRTPQVNQAGRKLDFITQEMLREANTVASKAGDTEITRCVVDIKCLIDRMKEQVQNVE